MKKFYIFILSIIFISCNPFEEKRVLKYKTELEDVVSKFEKYENGTYDNDEIDEFLIDNIRDLDIDKVVKNSGRKNSSYSGFIEENDSLIIFVQKADNILHVEKRIIYDFNIEPRNFGSEELTGASYKIVQLDERWYYSENGFD